MSFFDELKRRNVVRVATAYIVAAWLIIQVIDTVFRGVWLSEEAYRLFIIAVAIGFVPVVILAWVFQLTPEGVVVDKDAGTAGVSRDTARLVDRAIIVVLVVAVAYFVVEKFIDSEQPTPTIAVLPFENVGSDPEHDVFVTAMTFALRDLLTDIPELTVIARASTELAIEKYGRDIEAIRGALGVAHVLDGTVQAIGDRLRIDVQLIEARSQANRWSDTYDRPAADHYKIQDAIATEVVDQLKVNLVGSIPHADPVDPRVLSLVTAARLLAERQQLGIGQQMYDLLAQALEIDPDYVPALEWMMAANNELAEEGLISLEEESRRQEAGKARVLALDPDNSMLLFRSAIPRSLAGHLDEAAPIYTRAIEASPNDSRLLRMGSVFARRLGKFDVSLRLLTRAVTVDPLCYSCLYQLSRLQFEMEDYEAALATRRRYLQLGTGGEHHYGLMLLLTDRIDEAREHYENLVEDPVWRASGLAMVFHTLGDEAESDAQLERLQSMLGPDKHADYLTLVDAAVWTGRTDLAFEAIALQTEVDGYQMTFHVGNPFWKPLHSDPRWDELVEDLGLKDEKRAAVHFDPVLPD